MRLGNVQTGLSALFLRDAEGAKFDVVLNLWKKEKLTRYLFQLKKQGAVESSFVSLFDENGAEFSDQKSIERIQIDFDLDLEIQAELLDVLPFSLLQDDSKLCLV